MLRTMRAAVVAGFCLIGGIWLFAGYYFTGRMADLERRASAINARYTQAQELLSNAQSQVLLGSVYVRDALLDPDPTTADDYRRQLEAIYQSADKALGGYVPVFDEPAETQRIAELRREIDDFRRTLLDVLRTDSGQWPKDARTLLRKQIIPKREGVLQISEQVRALNRSAFVQQQEEFASLYRMAERRVWESFGIAVLASLGIALAAILYAGRLEHRIQRQRLTDLERTRDLERLSSQLLTAQEAERRSIARELHDEVGQVLTAIKVEISLAQRALESSGVKPDALESVRSITDGALHTVRDLSRLLHPAMLDDLGLVATVDTYLKGFGKRHGIRIELVQDGMDERLAADLEAGVYRVVQEALTNVVRHAQARSCRIYLQRLTNTVVVTIEDDGVGFSVDALHDHAESRGLGLIGIRERVAQMRGELRIESAPGHGTRLTIEVPSRVREDPAEDAISA